MAYMRVSPGGGGGTSIDLLWTNSSPTTAFQPQKISVDLSSYEQVIIQFSGNPAGSGEPMSSWSANIVAENKGVSNARIATGSSYGSVGAISYNRYITSIDDTGITFGNGSICQGTQQGETLNGAFGIPQKIWGIKTGIDYFGK